MEINVYPKGELNLVKILMDKPAPLISASSWVVLDRKSKSVIFGKLEKDRREIASLTKIMTLYTVLKLLDTLGIEINSNIKIEESVRDVIGTTANLCPGDTLTINDLLYGLMLPSGNDAAHTLALHFGQLVIDSTSK